MIWFAIWLGSSIALAQNPRYELLSDGVEHWYIEGEQGKPQFFEKFQTLFDIMFTDRPKLPFGQSVAFLIGVSQYQYISPQLPFVENDLQDMRTFLLNDGGFDHVYIASGKTVTRDLIEDYVRNKLPQWFSTEDRLLFYYSGHGADSGGRTGYMQFSEAQPGNFAGPQVLAINDVEDWCREVQMNHLLFIFDCCASGLAFAPRSGSDSAHNKMIETLSKNGSRTVITAGTADEKTFEVVFSKGRGNGVFTRAFLNAVETGKADKEKDGFMTIGEIMEQSKKEVAHFAVNYERSVSPRLWELEPNHYRGTFVFLNPEAKNLGLELMDDYSEKLPPIIEKVSSSPIPSPIIWIDYELEKAIKTELNISANDEILTSDLYKLTKLNASSKNILNLTGIEQCNNLESLDLSENQIKNIEPLSPLYQLKKLYLSENNYITDLTPISQLKELEELSLSEIQFSDMTFLKDLKNLRALDITSNQEIEDVSILCSLPALDELNISLCSTLNLKTLEGCSNLKKLTIWSMGIDDFGSIAKLEGLEELTIILEFSLDISEIYHLKNLKVISLTSCGIADISSLAPLNRLRVLHLPHNNIVSVDVIREFSSLTSLDLGSNKIKNIHSVLELRQLIELDLSNNLIESIDSIEQLSELEKINLSHNHISSLTFLPDTIRNFQEIDVSHNLIRDITRLYQIYEQDGMNRGLIINLGENELDLDPKGETIRIIRNLQDFGVKIIY